MAKKKRSSWVWAKAQKLMNEGKSREQAFAIAYDMQRRGKKGYIATPIQPSLLDTLKHWLRNDVKPGMTIIKGADGLRLMFIVTSNSYQDRDKEYISTDALQRYVDKSWPATDRCITNNVHLVWHGGDPVGDIVWTDMEGPFLLEVSKERLNQRVKLSPRHATTVKQVWDYWEANPDHIKWGASHGFNGHRLPDYVFHWIDKFETSTLPLANAANPITFSGVMIMTERDNLLDKLVGKSGIAAKLRKGVAQVGEQLDKEGVQHKDAPSQEEVVKGLVDNIGAKVDSLISTLMESPPAGLKEGILQLVLASMADATESGAEEDTGAEDMGDGAGMPPAPGPESKSAEKLNTLLDTLITTQNGQSQDIGALTKAIQNLKPLDDLQTVVKAFDDRVSDLEKTVGKLAGLLAGRPRAASQDARTVLTTSDAKGKKEIADKEAAAKAALAPVDPFWGDNGAKKG